MFKPFANSAQALAAGPLTWKTWTGLIVVPIAVMGLPTWALWSPDTDHGTATAAVVNNDEPVTVNGQTIPLGRKLAGNLTHDSKSAYTWVLTDADDAADGLDRGSYSAVVTIPTDFSARATSAATAKPLQATQAVLDIHTSSTVGVADASLSEHVALAAQRTLDQQVVETYLDNLYVGFNSVNKQTNKAADGAGQLSGDTGRLVSGGKKVAGGARQLSTSAARLSEGASELAASTAQLASGYRQLTNELNQTQRDTAQLPALTRQLASDASQVARGNEQITATVVPLVNRIIAAIDAQPSAPDAATELQRLANQCEANGGNAQFCQDLNHVADRASADAAWIDAGNTQVRASAIQVRDSLQTLPTGAREVANGNAQLANEAGALTRGIAGAASGANQLNSGIVAVNSDAQQLAGGARQHTSGARQLATGINKLDSGIVRANSGAQRLTTQLDNGRGQVPTYTDAERAHLKTVAANPTEATVDSPPFGLLALTLFAALALWALALAAYIVTRAVPDAVLTAREPTWRIIVRAALPGATAAALAALAISAIAVPVLSLDVPNALGFLAVALLAAFAFVALNQAATATFGRGARLASLVVLVLAAATGILSNLPDPIYTIAAYLPPHGAVLALRAIATDGPGLISGISQLSAWLAGGTLASIFVTDRRRYLSTRQLRAILQ